MGLNGFDAVLGVGSALNNDLSRRRLIQIDERNDAVRGGREVGSEARAALAGLHDIFRDQRMTRSGALGGTDQFAYRGGSTHRRFRK